MSQAPITTAIIDPAFQPRERPPLVPLPPCANPQKGAERHCGRCHYCLVRTQGQEYWRGGAASLFGTTDGLSLREAIDEGICVALEWKPRPRCGTKERPHIVAPGYGWRRCVQCGEVVEVVNQIAAIWRAAYREARRK